MLGLVEEVTNTQVDSGRGEEDTSVKDSVKIMVVGCGGAGNNTVSRLTKMGIDSAETIVMNTDAQHLGITEADKKLLIGKTITQGMGAGGYPEIGRKCAEMDRQVIKEALEGCELLFLTAGMGGGTGTGSAPVVAQVAKEMGAIVVSVVTYPFKLERARLKKADEGLRELAKVSDTVIILDNNKLVEYVPNLPMQQAFLVADEIVSKAIKGITDTIMYPSLVNIDFADIRAIMQNGGVATIGLGEAKGAKRVEEVVEKTLSQPLLDVDYRGGTGCLLHITGGDDLALGEITEIGESITLELKDDASVIWGAREDPSMHGGVRVTAIIMGVKSPQIMGRSIFTEADETVAVPAVSESVLRRRRVMNGEEPAIRTVSRPRINGTSPSMQVTSEIDVEYIL
ncbi:MAG: cell division protein FtsZ [Candidatus Diapherotrites archaeon]|nr:cell division protein FtsZ [Candidatus Diapherotrites archaeon]